MPGRTTTGGGTRRGFAAWVYIAVIAGAALFMFAVLVLLGNIRARKAEARETVFRVADLTERTTDASEWGKNFPHQYDSYLRTVDISHTKYGGSEAFDKIEEHPVWSVLFDGYAFSIDYREERGHAYMLDDQRETKRVTERPQPGACLSCHASSLSAWRDKGLELGAPGTAEDPLLSPAGLAQMRTGFEAVCAMPYTEATKLVNHPVTCLDCHDPNGLQLRVTRPAFMEGIAALAASEVPTPHLPSIERWRADGRRGAYDANTLASRQEMRSLVCGQCHVEYYFKGDGKLLTYPWSKGLRVEQIEAYYDEAGFKDWTHAVSGAPALKAQHPEFETWSQGIHARSGVACADCHMPYERRGAIKMSSHHVRSPLLSINSSCQTCHGFSEEEMLSRVESIQDRTRGLMDRAEQATLHCVNAIAAAAGRGAGDEELKEARGLHRAAQWRLDFVNAENSMGFHAPQESARILGEAIDLARRGQIAAGERNSSKAAQQQSSK